MKVKIQLTVDMEEVPQEVSSRIETIYYKLQASCDQVRNILKDISEKNPLEASQKIDSVRKDLSFFDSVLEDGYNILSGYASYKAKELEQNMPQVPKEEVSNE